MISDSKKKANKKWDDKNKERKKYINYKSKAKAFLTNLASDDDLEGFRSLIDKLLQKK